MTIVNAHGGNAVLTNIVQQANTTGPLEELWSSHLADLGIAPQASCPVAVTENDWVDDYRVWWNEGFHEESHLYTSPTYLLKITGGGVLLFWHQEDDRYEVFPAHAWRRVSPPQGNSPD